MAFKMKGSPHKMGGIQGTSSHDSALKQRKIPAWSGESETKGSKEIQEGLKDHTDEELIDIVKRNAGPAADAMLAPGEEYGPQANVIPELRAYRIAADSTRGAANELKLRNLIP